MDLGHEPLDSASVPPPQVSAAFIVPGDESTVDMPDVPLPSSSAVASSSSSSSSPGFPLAIASSPHLSSEVDMEVPENMARVMEAAVHEQRESQTVYFDYETELVHQTDTDGRSLVGFQSCTRTQLRKRFPFIAGGTDAAKRFECKKHPATNELWIGWPLG